MVSSTEVENVGGKTLRIGWGWLPDATCQRMLVADAGVAACGGAPRVSFFRLVPITVDEEKFLKEQGQAALEIQHTNFELIALGQLQRRGIVSG